jgi:hypothetical protein
MMEKLFQTECPGWLFGILVCALTLPAGCQQQEKSSPQGYDLSKPQEMQLGKVLNEISGLEFDRESGNILAVSDSKEKIFDIALTNKKLKDLTGKVVGPDSDLEDLVEIGDTIYLLSSWGELKAVAKGAKDSAGTKAYDIGLTGQNDFETLYYDSASKGLVMICKTCADEKGQGIRTAYRFDLTTKKFDSLPFFTINKKEVEDFLKDKDAKVDPSGAAINPIDKKLYILSSAGNLLIISDTRGKVIEAFHLNPDKFPQAEGIAFAPNGDMYISNEGKKGKPTLLFFPYRQGKKTK